MKILKNYKKFENSIIKSKFEESVENAGYWFQNQLPKDNLFDWEYFMEGNKISYYFYYGQYIKDKTIDEIFDYLQSENITWEFGDGLHSFAPPNIKKQNKVEFKLNLEQIIKYSELYDTTKKFNL